MSETGKLMTFDEFRASTNPPGDLLRQQRAFFRDPKAAEDLLRNGALDMKGWIPWDGYDAAAAR